MDMGVAKKILVTKEVNNMAERDKLELAFTEDRKTKRTVLFEEQLGEEAFSEQDVAVGNIYIKKEALELLGNPRKIKVTIEPMNE